MNHQNTCGFDGASCPAQTGRRFSTYSKFLKPFFSLFVSVLLTWSMSHLCEQYSTKNSVEIMRSDINTLRNSLNVLVKVTEGIKIQMKELVDTVSSTNSVKDELELYSADKTGMSDFALETLGGSILTTRDTELYTGVASQLKILGISICSQDNTPRAIIQPSVFPGQCWSFSGTHGSSVILLAGSVNIIGFSLEHISPKLAPTGEISTAPKEFSVFGLDDVDEEDGFLFGDYMYDISGPSIQYFHIQNNARRPYEMIEIKIRSNHGNKNYTCVYRFRVHGTLASSPRGIS